MVQTPPDPQVIAAAAATLRAGGVVAFPTETVYGLGADAFNEGAVREVFRLKGRPANNPLIVHVSGEAMARGIALPGAVPVVARWPDEASALAAAFWPGPLTIVLQRSEVVPAIVAAGGPSVAVRCPDHPVALALLHAFGGPLVGPSANPSGFVSPTTAAHVRESLGPEIQVIDGGPCRVGIESTVVSLTGATPRVLRLGAVSPEQIAGVLNRAVEIGPTRESAAESPGLLERHYAPRTPALLFAAAEWPLLSVRLGRERRVAVVTHHDRRVAPPHTIVKLPRDAEAYSAGLYAALREADASGATLIAIESPGETAPLWDSIRDRLRRATTPLGGAAEA